MALSASARDICDFQGNMSESKKRLRMCGLDLLPYDYWDAALNPPSYTPDELKAVQGQTRVPLHVSEVPIVDQIADSITEDWDR